MLVTYYKPVYMKSTVLTSLLFLLIGTVANAQLSFLPQVGFEQSRTTFNYGESSISGMQGNLKAGLKMDYRLKGGHSPFINLTTSPAPVNFVFSDGNSLANSYQSAKGNLQFRMEAGYQYSSRPFQFTKKGSTLKSDDFNTATASPGKKKNCGSSAYKSHCGQKKRSLKNRAENNFLNMRLQPSLAFAYIPSAGESIKQTPGGVEYNATNYKTAIVPAMGFEFAKDASDYLPLVFFIQSRCVRTEKRSKVFPVVKR